MPRPLSTTSIQDQVLNKLGITGITTYEAANNFFAQIGISVTPGKRQGRHSTPSVKILDTTVGGWSGGGDGDTFDAAPTRVDLSVLLQWITNPQGLPTRPPMPPLVIDGVAIQAAYEQEKDDELARRRAEEQRFSDQRKARAVQNTILRQHGYHWKN